MKHALAIRHVGFEDLGSLEGVLVDRGYRIEYMEAGVGDLASIHPGGPDLLVVLGGLIGAYEEDRYPFLTDEIRLIEGRLGLDRPTIGICLGSQLMARALGARVHPGPAKEIGWKPLVLTEAGERSPLAALNDVGLRVLHWHGDTFDLPSGATRLASSDVCENHAFSFRRNALGLQFHLETRAGDFERWLIGHAVEIAATPGVSVERLRVDTGKWGTGLEAAAAAGFSRWLDHA
jgi:GMP synthase (glutamine-hydrolysing)